MESPAIFPVLKLAWLLIPWTRELNHTLSTIHSTVSLRFVNDLVTVSQHQLSHTLNLVPWKIDLFKVPKGQSGGCHGIMSHTWPSENSQALLSKGGAEAGIFAELWEALALSPVGFIVEGVLPMKQGPLKQRPGDSCPITALCHATAFMFLVSSSLWSPVMTAHRNTTLHY